MGKLRTVLDLSAYTTEQLQALLAKVVRELDRRSFEYGLRLELERFMRTSRRTPH